MKRARMRRAVDRVCPENFGAQQGTRKTSTVLAHHPLVGRRYPGVLHVLSLRQPWLASCNSLCLAKRRLEAIPNLYKPWLLRIIAAARSPMMTQGAIVFPVVTLGMTEPSAMRNRSTP